MNLPTDVETARLLDAQDPLAAFRSRFVIADPDLDLPGRQFAGPAAQSRRRTGC